MIVNQILVSVGARMTVEAYRKAAMSICAASLYPFRKAIGSLGGAIRWGTVIIYNNIVVRVK